MDKLSEIIERLERATDPSRDLADDVLLACGWSVIEFGALDNPSHEWLAPDESTTYVGGDHPNPLASLDAAVSLVPEGMMYGLAGPWVYTADHEDETKRGRQIWEAAVDDGDNFCGDIESLTDFDNSGQGPTPAIALCIASLKARAVKEG